MRLPEAGLSRKQKVGGNDLGFCKTKTFDPGSRGPFSPNPTPLHFLSGESIYHITFMETTWGTQGATIKLSATAKYNKHTLGKERRSEPPLHQHTSQGFFQVCFYNPSRLLSMQISSEDYSHLFVGDSVLHITKK